MTSGGVNIAPTTNAPTITYGRISFSFSMETSPTPTSTTTTTGTSKVTPNAMKEIRPYVIVGAFVVGAVFTPPDVISQLMLAVPLWVLYELGILVAGILGKPQPAGAPPGPKLPAGPGESPPPPEWTGGRLTGRR